MTFELEPGGATPPPDDGPRRGTVWIRAYGGRIPGDVWVRLERSGGRWLSRQVRIDSEEPLSTATLRAIPLSAIIDRAVRLATVGGMSSPQLLLHTPAFTIKELADMILLGPSARVELGVQPPEKPFRKVGREGPTRADLEQFALDYQVAARISPRHPIAVTMDLLAAQGLDISRATANRWRDLCRATDPPLLPRAGRESSPEADLLTRSIAERATGDDDGKAERLLRLLHDDRRAEEEEADG